MYSACFYDHNRNNDVGTTTGGRGGAAIITVNAGGDAMYTSIQDAIHASNNSDTILVASGIYNENVIVNKSVNLTVMV